LSIWTQWQSRFGIDRERTAEALRAAGFRLAGDPGATRQELRVAGTWLVERAVRRSRSVSRIGGLGLAGLPPERVGQLVVRWRLAQRIAIVYGHNPSSDTGGRVVARAMAIAHGIAAPEQGYLEPSFQDILRALRGPVPEQATLTLARQTVGSTLRRALRRPARWLPVVGGFPDADLETRQVGERILDTISRLGRDRVWSTEDALEL